MKILEVLGVPRNDIADEAVAWSVVTSAVGFEKDFY
jgi:hypothetical protein